MASDTTSVSTQPERKASNRARLPSREHRRGLAESEGCECHWLRIGAISTRREKPERAWCEPTDLGDLLKTGHRWLIPQWQNEGGRMSVARVSEISSTSTKSFEDAIQQGLNRANKTLRNVKSAWIKEQQVRLEKGAVTEYQVNMMITFVLDD